MPITWKNIQAPDFSGAADMFSDARASFRDMTSGFQKMIADRNALEQQNINTLRENNANDFKDYLASFRTPEELAAAQASGAIQQRLAGFNGAIDRSLARTGADDRLSYVRKQTQDAQAYADMQEELKARGAFNNALDEALAGNLTTARSLLDPLNTANKPELLAKVFDVYTRRTGEDRAVNQDKRAADANTRGWNRDARDAAAEARSQLTFEDTQARQKERDALNVTLADAFRQRTEQTNNYYGGIKETVASLNRQGHKIPVGEDGLPVIAFNPDGTLDESKGINQRNLDVLERGLARRGIDINTPQQSESEFRNGLVNSLLTVGADGKRKFNYISPEDINSGFASIDSMLNAGNNITKNEQAKLDAETQMANALVKDNVFKDVFDADPNAVVSNILKKYTTKNEDGETVVFGNDGVSSGRSARLQELNDIAANGVVVKGKRYKVPEAMLDTALAQYLDSNWYNNYGGSIKDNLKAMISQEGYAAQYDIAESVHKGKQSRSATYKNKVLPDIQTRMSSFRSSLEAARKKRKQDN